MKFQAFSLLVVAGIVLFTGVTLVGPFSAVRQQLVTVESIENDFSHLFAMIFDAGSTGTRLHVFTFLNNTNGQLIFESEQYFHTEPGLSHYADNPKQAALSLVPLMREAQKIIPARKWHVTPVSLKATAGLRLLAPHVTDIILYHVQDFLEHSSFFIRNDSVSVMDGTDEGIFAWYTVNYLLGLLEDSSKSVATLDLGGGSTQVTFAPRDFSTIKNSPPTHITKKPLADQTLYLYTHSYLGLGLMSARQSIVLATTPDPSLDEDEIMDVTSPCFPSNMQHSWFHAGQEYRILGMGSSWNRYAECLQQTKLFVIGNTHVSKELTNRDVYVLSYYFDRAVDAGLIDRHKGGTLTVEAYSQAAKSVCAKNSPEKPFLCLDLCYIGSLLHFGFGLGWNKEVSVVKKIHEVEASWALGAAFDLIS